MWWDTAKVCCDAYPYDVRLAPRVMQQERRIRLQIAVLMGLCILAFGASVALLFTLPELTALTALLAMLPSVCALAVLLTLLPTRREGATRSAAAFGTVLRSWLDARYDDATTTLPQTPDNPELGDLVKRVTERLKRRDIVQQQFKRVMAPELASAMMASGRVELGGRETRAAILFVDIRGFTAIAHRRKPRQVLNILNTFFGEAVPLIEANGGVVDKFVGDGMMALFGIPKSLGNNALCAIDAAIELQTLAHSLNDQDVYGDGVKLDVGIGVAKGNVIAGTIGATHRLNYTAIGATVNLAARLCSYAGRGQVLCCNFSYLDVRDHVRATRLEAIRLKGIDVEIYTYVVSGWAKGKPSAKHFAVQEGESRAAPPKQSDRMQRVEEVDSADLARRVTRKLPTLRPSERQAAVSDRNPASDDSGRNQTAQVSGDVRPTTASSRRAPATPTGERPTASSSRREPAAPATAASGSSRRQSTPPVARDSTRSARPPSKVTKPAAAASVEKPPSRPRSPSASSGMRPPVHASAEKALDGDPERDAIYAPTDSINDADLADLVNREEVSRANDATPAANAGAANPTTSVEQSRQGPKSISGGFVSSLAGEDSGRLGQGAADSSAGSDKKKTVSAPAKKTPLK